MLQMIKAMFAAIAALWEAIPESVKAKAVDTAFSLIEQLVRAFFRSKHTQTKGETE